MKKNGFEKRKSLLSWIRQNWEEVALGSFLLCIVEIAAGGIIVICGGAMWLWIMLFALATLSFLFGIIV